MKKLILFSVAAFGLATMSVQSGRSAHKSVPVIGDAEVLEDVAGRVCKRKFLSKVIPFSE